MRLLKEQLIYDIKGNSIKSPFLYVKKCYLNDLYYKTLNVKVHDSFFEHVYKQRVNIFFKKYFPKIVPKKLTLIKKNFVILKNDINPISKYDLKYKLMFTPLSKDNINGSFTKPDLIRMNSNKFSDLIKSFPQYMENLIETFQERLYKIILRDIKRIFVTVKHEIIHLIDFQNSDKQRKILFNKEYSDYYLEDLEFPTWLSNTYSEIKALTLSGRKKLPYKMFAKFLKGENIYLEQRVAHSDFLRALFKKNSEKHQEASERLFNLLKKNYLYDDGYKIFSKPIVVG